MVSLCGKTVLITGCSTGGIGAALALEYHSRGYHVFATSRSLASMEPLAAQGIDTFALDVSKPGTIREARQRVSLLTGGKLNVLVNNAGIAVDGAVSDLCMQDVRDLFDVNLFGVMELTHEFLPLLLAASDSRSVRIINIASVASTLSVPFLGSYSASKAALVAFGDTLRLELAPFGIKVISVISGTVQTNIGVITQPFSFPPDSIYKPIEKEYLKHRLSTYDQCATSPAEFARRVVSEGEKANPKAHFWVGTQSTKVWLAKTFLPVWIIDRLLKDRFSLPKLTKLIKKGEVKRPSSS